MDYACPETIGWNVGLRIGAALDLSSKRKCVDSVTDGYGTGVPVRPHIRRAHWHSFWVGKRGEQTLSLRWLPPIAVNTEEAGNLPAVIRQAQGLHPA